MYILFLNFKLIHIRGAIYPNYFLLTTYIL